MELSLLVPDRGARVPLAVQLADGLRTAARAAPRRTVLRAVGDSGTVGEVAVVTSSA